MTGPRFPEVDNDLLCLVSIEDQVVDFAPVHQVLHLFPVGQFVVTLDESHCSCVVRQLHKVVGAESGTTVVGHQGEQQGAENTALGGTGAQGE